jgi:hypothetical protein
VKNVGDRGESAILHGQSLENYMQQMILHDAADTLA